MKKYATLRVDYRSANAPGEKYNMYRFCMAANYCDT